jgi:hypothetical protein
MPAARITPQWSEIAALDPSLYALPEDPGDTDGLSTVPEHLGIHNAPYPRSQWARRGTPPSSPVGLVTGTYVGNGTSRRVSKNCSSGSRSTS